MSQISCSSAVRGSAQNPPADHTTDQDVPGDAGFSLLELMVVVVILSVLALVIVPRVIDRPDQARMVRARTDIAAISSAMKFYRLDNFRYPTTEQGLAALVSPPSSAPLAPNWSEGGYVDHLPKDPWGAGLQLSVAGGAWRF